MFNLHAPIVVDPYYKTIQANIYKKGFKHPFILRFSFPKEKEPEAVAWISEAISLSERKHRRKKKVTRPIIQVVDGKFSDLFYETGIPHLSLEQLKAKIQFHPEKNLHLHAV